MTAQTQSQRNASYRQRQREKIARMRTIIQLLCDRADAVQNISGGTVQHSDLFVATVAARNILAGDQV